MKKKIEERNTYLPIRKQTLKKEKKFLVDFYTLRNEYGYSRSLSEYLDKIQNKSVGNELGINNVSGGKHGWDCLYSNGKHKLYIEVKNVDMKAKEKLANFNDITIEKANSFSKDNICVAMALWESSSEPMCIIFGKTSGSFSDYLIKVTEEHDIDMKNGKTTNPRNNRTFTPFQLVNNFGFKIITKQNPKEVIKKLSTINGRFAEIDESDIIPTDKFNITEYMS